AFPNPFERLTMISYSLTNAANVSIDLYNESGLNVKQLVVNEAQSAGDYQFAFDGSRLPSGIYFCSVLINGKTTIYKLVLNR
ncbi:MAG: T9SS type A sorting domain-containing protein, partial [Chitinophagales bacterium]